MNKLESLLKDSMNNHSDESLALIIMACRREGNYKMRERAERILEERKKEQGDKAKD